MPDTGHDWKAVCPPVCRSFWTRSAAGQLQGASVDLAKNCWTTVAHWYGYSEVEWEGRSYSNKAPEFEKLRDWPKRSGVTPRVVTDLGAGRSGVCLRKQVGSF